MRYFYQKIKNILENSKEPCFVHYDKKYYYQELYQNILKINNVLKDLKQQRIMLYTQKSFETYAALFSIFLSENVWIPANPEHPEKRIIEMLKLAEPALIIADCILPEEISEFAKSYNIKIVLLNDLLILDKQIEITLGEFSQDDLAYIMFTSGSTGIPKGVPMTHGNYINFINNAMEILPFTKREIFSDYHDLGFDISIFYLFCCILTESAFAPVLSGAEKLFPIDNVVKNKVTVWSTVPSALLRIMKLRPNDVIKNNINIMFLCGEPFPLDVLKYCYNNLNIENVYNFYGLTETGVENFYHLCKKTDIKRFEKQGYIPIGKPLKGNEIKVTETKELLIAGCQITPGYLGGIGKERFENIKGKDWFYSGDIVEPFGDVYFCKGRLDSQVKLSGYRVELMDIEVHIRHFPGVRNAVCFIHEQRRGENTLICAIEAEDSISTKDLKSSLKKELPSYMIPSSLFILEEFPLNKSGKIDRKTLKEQLLLKK